MRSTERNQESERCGVWGRQDGTGFLGTGRGARVRDVDEIDSGGARQSMRAGALWWGSLWQTGMICSHLCHWEHAETTSDTVLSVTSAQASPVVTYDLMELFSRKWQSAFTVLNFANLHRPRPCLKNYKQSIKKVKNRSNRLAIWLKWLRLLKGLER